MPARTHSIFILSHHRIHTNQLSAPLSVLSSPEIFRSSANIISPGHDEPEAGVQGEIPEGMTRGKCGSKSRKVQAKVPHSITGSFSP
jgi:hypothetical protein